MTAVVKPFTDSAASNPVVLVKINAAFADSKDSFKPLPCLENSKVASEASLKDVPVFLAMSKMPELTSFKFANVSPPIVLIWVRASSTSFVEAIKFLNAEVIKLIVPTEAPNANTRAFAASIDFVNSSA